VAEATRQLTLRSELAAVGAASDWIRALGAEFALLPDDVYRLDLCVAELLANVASYAYADGGAHPVSIRARMNERSATLEIADEGKPFDPVAWRPPQRAVPLGEATVGGWGLRLVQQFADECRYVRRGGRNVTTLRFRRQRPPAIGSSAHVARGPERRMREAPATFPLTRSDGTRVDAEQRAGIDRRILGFISRFEIFRGVPYDRVEDVIASCRVMRFEDGQVLLKPGERNDVLAFVLSGRLRVHLDTPDSSNFFSIVAGQYAGELSVIDTKPVSAYVVADSGCRVLEVDAEVLFGRLLAIPEVNRNFIAGLAERVRRTSARVVDQIRGELELAQLQRDLAFAQEIQAGMLPQESPLFAERADVDCAGRLRAARQVGGDFYDAFFVDEHRLFVAIGDVCGKGLPAALFMVRAMTLLRSEAGRRAGSRRAYVQRIVERLNRLLFERNDQSLFTTLFCAVLDTATGTLAYVNAGHNPPAFVVGPGGFGLLEGPRNPLVGIVDGLSFTGAELQLAPGSVLVLYTDGVTEARNREDEHFGVGRLLATLDGAAREASALIEATLAAVDAFAGPVAQADDITLLALRFRGPTAA
jgi:serine phosphatase RsbU (regulator of sigma subunit)/anti-sigma regulatory factor (Ser/Thr protein kinase)